MLQRLFRTRPAVQVGAALYESATRQARSPALYRDLGAPDSVEGRFELYSLHVILLLHRLRGAGGTAAEISQALFDAYIRALDDALREMGVGDLSVGKKMRKLGEAFYGRAKAYEDVLAGPDEALEALIGRTVFAEAVTGGQPQAMALYVRRAQAVLAEQTTDDLLAGDVRWAEVAG